MGDTPPTMQIDVELVRQLAELLDKSNLSEIEVEDADRRIKVVRQPSFGGFVGNEAYLPTVTAPVAPAPASPAPAPAPMQVSDVEHPGTIRSPMVGTAYLAPEPAAKPFVSVGDRIEAGATLVIIEAMKVMNAIPSPRAGTVVAIHVANGQPIEFDQPLVVVD